MRRSHLLFAAFAATSILSAIACSSSTTEPPPAADQTGIVPPKQPQNGAALPPAAGDAPAVFAVNKLYLGSTKRDGTTDLQNGWKEYGYNLDGKISTPTSSDLCKPRPGAQTQNVYPDGKEGIDNAFGKSIMPFIRGVAANAESDINDSLLEGSFTLLISIDKFGAAKDYNPLDARLYAGDDLGAAPKFDGSDVWNVRPELLTDAADIKSSKVHFDQAYLADNVFVSNTFEPGHGGDITLSLSVSGFSIDLTIAHAVITMKMSDDHKSATEGVIAGILETDVLKSELTKVAGAFSTDFCEGNSTLDSLLTQIEQASDIMKDGSQDPNQVCNGISIGLGFDMKPAQLGVVAPPSMSDNPCAMGTGGAGGGSGSGGAGTGGAGGN